MRKITAILILGSFALGTVGTISIAQAQALPLTKGQKNDEVKAIQKILKEDPTIYPEGYTTGYFGELTEKAIKKLQKKYKIPETGIIDEETEKIIFPYVEFKIVAPNGGEVWDRAQIQTISWEVATPAKETAFLWPKASIDLYKEVVESSIFVKHIAFVNIFDGSYTWKISQDIPNGDNYLIRISTGRRIIPCLLPLGEEEKTACLKAKLLPPPGVSQPGAKGVPLSRLVWDESDEPFTIKGEIPTPLPLPDLTEVIKTLEKISLNLEKTVKDLIKAIEMLKEMVSD